MALYTNVNVSKESGYTKQLVQSCVMLEEYNEDSARAQTLSASPTGVSISLGMTLAKMVYVETDADISVKINGGSESTTVDKLYFLMGASVTGMIVTAATGANLKIYTAG